MRLVIGYLYGNLMNIYGDTGNIIALKKRAEWRGIEVEIKKISVGDRIPTRQHVRLRSVLTLSLPKGQVGTQIDIYFFGGGQDQAQAEVAADLGKSGKGKVIKSEIERGVPLLSICGGYQLLGEYYKPHKGPKLPGVGLFSAYTVANDQRMIGNIVVRVQGTVDSEQKKTVTSNLSPVTSLVGFENHSGKTYLKDGAQPFGYVISGFGNNGEDKTEGCIYKNAIGTYMHGSLLPKNPALADWLLQKALEARYGKEIKLKPLDDSLETKAHQIAIQKFA